MSLTPEQKQTVATWVAAGDNLSTVQKKLTEQFSVSMTYRDVRFLVDDLNLELKDPAPKVDASDVTKTPPASKPASAAPRSGAAPSAPGSTKDAGEPAASDEFPEDATGADGAAAADGEEFPDEAYPPAGTGAGVTVAVDKITLMPGAIASGSVTFSDGVTGKWIVDQQGRPGFTEVSQPGYRPTSADAQSFMRELSMALQRRGF